MPELTKKDKVRDHLKTMKDGDKFTYSSLANDLEITDKDVSNACTGMVKFGAMTAQNVYPGNGTHKRLEFTVRQKPMVAFLVKFPNGYKGKPLALVETPPLKKSPKRRNSVLIGIDNKIKEHELKIANLKSLRSEYK